MVAQRLSVVLGIWLMIAPAVFGEADRARTNDRIVGPIAAAIAAVAVHEVVRPVRRINVVVGLWLLVAPWVLAYGVPALLNSTVVGLLLIFFAMVPDRSRHCFGGGWSALWATGVAS